MIIKKTFNKQCRVFSIFALICIIILSTSGFAQIDSTVSNSTTQPVIQDAGELHFGKVLLRTIFSLFLVILFLAIFLLGLRWLQNHTRANTNRMHTLSVQDSLAIGPKKQLHLIQVLDRVLLIGSAENSISLLLELNDEEKLKLLEKKSSKTLSFSKTLATQIAKLGGAHKS